MILIVVYTRRFHFHYLPPEVPQCALNSRLRVFKSSCKYFFFTKECFSRREGRLRWMGEFPYELLQAHTPTQWPACLAVTNTGQGMEKVTKCARYSLDTAHRLAGCVGLFGFSSYFSVCTKVSCGRLMASSVWSEGRLVSRLAVEIISEVMEALVNSKPTTDTLPTALCLSAVCRLWRSVAQGSGVLWTRLEIDLRGYMAKSVWEVDRRSEPLSRPGSNGCNCLHHVLAGRRPN